tara:strand:+ start:226 stop:444 length:219 start_codon:yes stop_codon:yes gene_type:complete
MECKPMTRKDYRKYNRTFEIKVNYFSDLFNEGVLVNDDFTILPTQIKDNDLQIKLFDLIDDFLQKRIEQKQA